MKSPDFAPVTSSTISSAKTFDKNPFKKSEVRSIAKNAVLFNFIRCAIPRSEVSRKQAIARNGPLLGVILHKVLGIRKKTLGTAPRRENCLQRSRFWPYLGLLSKKPKEKPLDRKSTRLNS